jgi:hypothetical protein
LPHGVLCPEIGQAQERESIEHRWTSERWAKGGKQELTTITIYKPNGDDSVRYTDPDSILVDKGVLSFYWTKEITGKKQKIVTTLPFLIQHDMNGMPSDNVI